MPSIQTNAAIRRAGAFHELKRILQTSDHGEWHQLEAHFSSPLSRLSAQSSESLDQAWHRRRFLIEITHFKVMCLEDFGCIEQHGLPNVGLPLALTIEKPVGEEFKLDILDAVVVENLLHLPERELPEHMLKIGMPDSKPGETGSGSRFHAVLEIEGAIFFVGVRQCTRNRPVRREQINVAMHCAFSSSYCFLCQHRFHSLNDLFFTRDDESFQWFAIRNGSVEGSHHPKRVERPDCMLSDLARNDGGSR